MCTSEIEHEEGLTPLEISDAKYRDMLRQGIVNGVKGSFDLHRQLVNNRITRLKIHQNISDESLLGRFAFRSANKILQRFSERLGDDLVPKNLIRQNFLNMESTFKATGSFTSFIPFLKSASPMEFIEKNNRATHIQYSNFAGEIVKDLLREIISHDLVLDELYLKTDIPMMEQVTLINNLELLLEGSEKVFVVSEGHIEMGNLKSLIGLIRNEIVEYTNPYVYELFDNILNSYLLNIQETSE